jgi:hypothetical protein
MQVTEVAAPLQPNIMALVTANILQRARESGRCPPSLLTEDRIFNNDGFDAAVEKVLDVSGTWLSVHVPRHAEFQVFSDAGAFLFVVLATDDTGLALASDPSVAESFKSLLQVGEGME